MYKESMSIPLFSRFVFLFDFFVCVLYLYTIAYLLKNEGATILSLDHIEILFFVAIALTGAVIDPFLLFGKPSFVFIGYLLLVTGLVPFVMGFFQTSKMYETMPQVIPVLGKLDNLFKQTAVLRGGFSGLYLVSLLKISMGYKSYMKRQKDQKHRECSGKGMGAVRLNYKPKKEVRTRRVVQEKPKRTKLNVILFLTAMMIITEISLFLFNPEFNDKISKNISKSLDNCLELIQKVSEKTKIKLDQGKNNDTVDTKQTVSIQNKVDTKNNDTDAKSNSGTDSLSNVFKFFENTKKTVDKRSQKISNTYNASFKDDSKMLTRYFTQLEQNIKISLSKKMNGIPVTLNDAMKQICDKAAVPYLDSKMEAGNKNINMVINSSNAKASDLIQLLVESAGINYGLCSKGLYLKETNKNVNWQTLELYRK